jgi:hypothetical protein
MQAITVEGWIIGLFVILNGIYVVAFPPAGDEPQGLAIIAIGAFIILATMHYTGTLDREEGGRQEKAPR